MSKAAPPLIGQETIPPGEEQQIQQLISLHRGIQELTDAKNSPTRRNLHPKQHGCLLAEFTVLPSVPANCRHGLFSQPRTFPAVVRLSNAKQPDDRLPDGHGMAVKLFGVPGAKLLEADNQAETHDFIAVDHPVFFARAAADMVPLLQDFKRLMTGGPLAKAATVAKAALSRRTQYRILRAAGAKRPDNLLHVRYWSMTPYRLGDAAMKFSFVPRPPSAPAQSVRAADKFRKHMATVLAKNDVIFDVAVQVQTDPLAMPIEDATVEWDEGRSPFMPVATLRIPAQFFDTPARQGFGETLSFNPWHALQDHRPLGGINRVRRQLYHEMATRRRELNGKAATEPTLADVRRVFG